MKKLLLILVCLALMLSLCACREEPEPEIEAEPEGFEYIDALNDALDVAQSGVENFENHTDRYEDALGEMGIYLD